jgi:iron complex transport system substrate-binding protein
MTAVINVEQILTWNPQIIITKSSAIRDQIIADRALRSLSAVKNDKIYVVPTGAHLWSVRSAEGALQPLWLAKRLHPDLFKTLDLEKEVKSFYKRFYGYELSDAQIADILKGGSTTALR